MPTSHCTVSTLCLEDDAPAGQAQPAATQEQRAQEPCGEGQKQGAHSTVDTPADPAVTADAASATKPAPATCATAENTAKGEDEGVGGGAESAPVHEPPLQRLRRQLCVVPAGVPQLVLPNHPIAADSGLAVFAAKDFRTMQVRRGELGLNCSKEAGRHAYGMAGPGCVAAKDFRTMQLRYGAERTMQVRFGVELGIEAALMGRGKLAVCAAARTSAPCRQSSARVNCMERSCGQTQSGGRLFVVPALV